MYILQLPFNQFIDIKAASDPDYLLCLDNRTEYTNHLGTVHASALFSLAEASSGHFLFIHFPEYHSGIIPVVRQVEVKYKKPAMGKILSKAMFTDTAVDEIKEQLATRKRASFRIKVDLYDMNQIPVMTGTFEWFVTLSNTSS